MSETSPVGLLGTLIERWRQKERHWQEHPDDDIPGFCYRRFADELEAALATLPTSGGCLNCGETDQGGYQNEEVGPFCRDCWESLQKTMTAALPPAPPQDLEQRIEHYTSTAPRDERAWFQIGDVRDLVRRVLTEAASPPAQEPQEYVIGELKHALNEWTAVCACGCPIAEHDNYGEDGEACGHDDHECIRTSKAVYALLHTLREKLAAPAQEQEPWPKNRAVEDDRWDKEP